MFKLPKKLYAIFITTGVLLFIFVFFKILSHTYGQHLNDDTMDTLVGVLIAACDTNNTLPEDHLKIVDECEKMVPSVVSCYLIHVQYTKIIILMCKMNY